MENENEAPFVIPESAFGPIRDLVDLTEENFDAFMAGLSSASPTVSTNALSRHISRSASGIPRSVVQALVGEIMTLEYLKQDSEMEPMEFASGLSASALEAVSEDFKFDAPDAEILTKRVFRIFSSVHDLQLTTKASTAVMTDHSHLFLRAKILTDARPVHYKADITRTIFRALVQQWKKETGHFSVFEQKASHPAYQCIIELGESLLPLLIDELKNSPRNWFWALRKIAKCNPVRPNATVQEAVMDWTEWWNNENTKYGRVDRRRKRTSLSVSETPELRKDQ